ncbi:hypothetical protein CK203_063178 [Vitis vinifera]|uniref:HR-like lesion-inducer n=1 Tax=Vitis vinifera TaxID=29760 RepID=A0A438G4F1_VITVI|nr:hypothetical protein CK203_063178 [Vitis vinifera]
MVDADVVGGTRGFLGRSGLFKPVRHSRNSEVGSAGFRSFYTYIASPVLHLRERGRRQRRDSKTFHQLSCVRTSMAFVSFVGRVLFASVFILSAWQEVEQYSVLFRFLLYGLDFGWFNEFGVDGGPAAESLAPKLDVFSKHVSANVGVQVPEVEIKNLVAASIALKGLGGLLFIFGSSLGAHLLLLHQAIVIPILYDFYNYDVDKKEFVVLFLKFTQNLALFGALLFFIGMKNSMPRRQLKKKAPKTKTV